MKTWKYFTLVVLTFVMGITAAGCSSDDDSQNPAADKTALRVELKTARDLLDKAVEGTQAGQYPKTAIDAFTTAVEEAAAVEQNAGSSQKEVDQALDALKTAVATFKASVVQAPDVDKTALKTALDEAEDVIASAVEGDAEGQYTKAVMDAFRAAIETAQGVYNDVQATQAAADKAAADLKTAQETFLASANTAPQADKTALKAALDEADATFASAVEGDAEGQYTKAVMDAFRAAIAAAREVYDAADASQAAIDKATADLKAAVETFLASVNTGTDDPALSLWLAFNGDATDASPFRHTVELKTGETGQPAPSLTTDRMGAPDQAYKFEGGFMSIANHASLNAPQMSVLFWMCSDALSATDMAPLSFNWWDCYMAKIIGGGQNEIAFVAGGASVQSGVMIDPGRWYHVAISRSDSELAIYVDGELKNTQSAGPMNRVEVEPLRIGVLSENPGYYYPYFGALDEIRIYGKALTADEIKAVYDTERP